MDADDIIILGFLFVVFVCTMYIIATVISVHSGCVILPIDYENITVDRIVNDRILDTTGKKWKVSNDVLDLQLVNPGTNITVVCASHGWLKDHMVAKVVKIEGKAI